MSSFTPCINADLNFYDNASTSLMNCEFAYHENKPVFMVTSERPVFYVLSREMVTFYTRHLGLYPTLGLRSELGTLNCKVFAPKLP
jgi:hypothetical protein